MNIKDTCKCCGRTTEREIREGDILYPYDGSGMSGKLHEILWNGLHHNCQPFKPVRVSVVYGDGEIIGVVPLHTCDTYHTGATISPWKMVTKDGEWKPDHNVSSSKVFLIHAPTCSLRSK